MYICFHNEIMLNDFIMINKNNCIYTKRSYDKFIILSLYVNHIVITGIARSMSMKLKDDCHLTSKGKT